MKLNVAVQMDPIERINIRGDSTFARLLEAQKRGHGISYYTPDKLSLRGEEIVAPVQLLTVRDGPGDHSTLGEPKREALNGFDVVLLRQDPPFDLAYITSTHLLERIHPKTLVVNDPASVRNAPEKLFVMNFPQLMPPTLISRDLDEINAFRDRHGAVVMKPLHGHGGAAVFRVMPQDMNFGSLFDMFSVTFREPWVIQRFLPEVKHGDKRIILVDGEFAGAVNRVPAADDLRSNMVRGGAAQATELAPPERLILLANFREQEQPVAADQSVRATKQNSIKNNGGRPMTINVSRRSLLALGAGLGASTLLGGSALARAPKLGTQTPYWHR